MLPFPIKVSQQYDHNIYIVFSGIVSTVCTTLQTASLFVESQSCVDDDNKIPHHEKIELMAEYANGSLNSTFGTISNSIELQIVLYLISFIFVL